MSGFSGKCDFYDQVVAISEFTDEDFRRSKFFIFQNDREHELKIDNGFDAIKYYPYLVSFSCISKNQSSSICLASDSFIDREESEHLTWKMENIKRYYRRCKRLKKKFNKEEAMNEISIWNKDDPNVIEMINRVEKYGNDATIEGLHDNLHEYYRREWYNYMIEAGYNEDYAASWVYKDIFTTKENVKDRIERGGR